MSPEDHFFLERARKYCSYQERCLAEVQTKLTQWSLSESAIQKIIKKLEEEDYINEERYAISFALGKLRNNKWGKNKIFRAMTQKGIPEIYIQMGLNEISDEEYMNTLKKILEAKHIDDKDPYKRNHKLARYAIQKGFQPALVWKVVNGEA